MKPLRDLKSPFATPAERALAARLEAAQLARQRAELEERHRAVAAQQELFRAKLAAFGDRHRARIAADPAFRRLFLSAASAVGVDLLARSKGGAAGAEGGGGGGGGGGIGAAAAGLGSFYFELGVQVVDACLATRAENGGLIAMRDLLARLRRSREARHRAGGASAAAAAAAAAAELSAEDVRHAVDKLAVLGDEFKVVSMAPRVGAAAAGAGAALAPPGGAEAAAAGRGAAPRPGIAAGGASAAAVAGAGASDEDTQFVLSVPAALAEGDSCREALQFVLQQQHLQQQQQQQQSAAAGGRGEGFATASSLARGLRWDAAKSRSVLEALLKDGLCWLDSQGGGGEDRVYVLALAFG